MPLTDYPLYELERYARRKGYDIDRLRQDYWDEMLSSGKAGQEGSVRQQAVKSRVFDTPVDELEPLPPIEFKPRQEQGRDHLKQLAGSILGSFPEAFGEVARTGLGVGSTLRGIPPVPGTEAGELIPKVARAEEAAQGLIGDLGFGEKLPEPDWDKNKIAATAQMLEKMLAESAGYMAIPGVGQAGRALSPASRVGRAAIEGLGFGGLTAGGGVLEGEAPEEALKEGAMTAAGVAGIHGLGALASKAGKGIRKAYAGAFRDGKVEVPAKVEPVVEAPPEVVPPKAELPDLTTLSDDDLQKILFEKVMLEADEDAEKIVRAEIARRKTAPEVTPEEVPPAEVPPVEPIKTPEQRTTGLTDLIEAQDAEAQAARAARLGVTPEELARRDALGQREQLTETAIKEGTELPLAPPGEPEIAGMPGSPPRVEPPVEPPAMAPEAPVAGVPPEGVPPVGREGERGFAKLDLLTGGAAKEERKVGLRHFGYPGRPTKPDANGLVWFTHGDSYLKGDKYFELDVPENKILDLNDVDALNKYLKSPFGKRGRSKAAEMQYAESLGYDAVRRGDDVAMRPDTGAKYQGRLVEGGREGERGFISLGTLFPSLGKAQQAQKQTAAQAIAAGAPTVLSPRLQAGIDGIESRLGILAERMSKRVGDLGFANADEAAKFGDMIVNSADDVSLRGWTKTERAQRQAAMARAPREQTHSMGTSERDVQEWTTTLTTLAKELDALNRQSIAETGMSLKDMGGQQLYELLGRMHRASDIQGTAAGRTLAARRQSAAVIASLAKQFGLNLNGLKVAMSAERDPIYTSLVQAAKDFTSATSGEARTKAAKEFGSKFTDAWRMNLFTVGSWTLDMVGNLFSLAMETPGIIGEDVARALRGDVSLASSRGAAKALLTGRFARRAPLAVEQSLGMATAGGERVGGKMFSTGKGAFTRGVVPGRSAARNAFSVAVDKIAGAPLYAKAAFDTGFKRLGAMAAIYRDATLRANAALKSGKIKPDQYDAYVQQLVQKPDAAMVESATALANKLGFNRPLYQGAEALAKNPLYKLFGAAFGRWPFQMTAALAEWVGMNPGAWKAAAQSGRPGALVGQLAKAATGIGGLALLNKSGIYERMDWKTMEYVQEDGDRVRIGGREPLATGMTLLTMLRGDEKAFLDSIKFSSIPFAGLISGDGGLLSSVITKLRQAQERRDLDPKALSKEASRMIAKLIPGQALLAAIKVAFDPTTREQDFPAGIGAELPGVSRMLPAQIDPTTGEPRKPTQRILGSPEIPAAGGVVVPGAERALSPVHQLLSAYGLMNYKMPRRPLPMMGEGVDPKMDPEWQRRWYELYGAERVKTIGPITEELLEKRKGVPFGSRVRLLDEIKSYNKLIKGGLSSDEAGDRIWGKDWKSSLNLARQLESDLKIIQKRDQAAMDAAFQKLTAEMRRSRRERRQ